MNAAFLGMAAVGGVYITIVVVDILNQLKRISDQLGALHYELTQHRPRELHYIEDDDI